MNNNEILKNRWDKIDAKISKYLKEYSSVNKTMRDNIQDVFNSIQFTIDDIYNYASITDIARLQRKINDLKDKYKLSGYENYILKEYEKNKLRNSEVLLGLIIIEYIRQNKELEDSEKKLFEDISTIAYEQGQKEMKPKKIKLLPMILLSTLLTKPVYRNYIWKDYKNGNITYQAKQLLDRAVVEMQQNRVLDVNNNNIKSLLDKQSNSYIKKKSPTPSLKYYDKYMGSLDTAICYIANQMALEGMKAQGCKEVIFVAVMDGVTTDMCATLNGQKFSIYEENVYSRYSAIDNKNIIYHTKGLQVGANLPPIDNNYHHCRSTIFPVR